MSIESIGATVTFDAAPVGTLVDFSAPADENKEYEDTGLGDTRESFKRSAMKVGQIFTYTIRYDTEAKPVATDSDGTWVITLPIQTPPNASNETQTFDGYVVSKGPLEGSVTGSEGLTQAYNIRLTTENVIVDETV